jgi:hypothetical protein
MTYREDSNMPRRPMVRDEASYTSCVLGALGVLMVAGAVLFMVNKDDGTQTVNNNTNRPSATAPANSSPPSTTGSGATTPAPANR